MTTSSPDPTPVAPAEPRDPGVIQGHTYDGIREYDNPMPGWWIWLFWGAIVFAVVYVLGIGVFGFIDTYQEDLSQSQEQLQAVRAAYEAAHPTVEVNEETLASYANDPARVQAGAALFQAQCVACHGTEGQGLIGPNLTDDYWLHGDTDVDLYNVITSGVVAQGMPPWEGVFSTEERAELVAFVRSIQGSNPPNPKEPQGEEYPPADGETEGS